MEKKVIFLVSTPPFGLLNNYEALRSSISLFDHKVSVIWIGDGVYFPLKQSDKTMTQSFLRLVGDLNIHLLVDIDELKQRGFSKEDIIPQVDPLPNEKIVEILASSDYVVNF